jgi:hypothetical protein
MSNSRAERIARDKAARQRRRKKKEICFMCTLREWARKHRLRLKRNKNSH